MSGSRVDRLGDGERGDHENTFPFVGRVSGQLRLYGERERGGRGDGQRRGKPIFSTRNSKIIDKELKIIGGGRRLLPGRSPPTPTPNYYQPHRSEGENYQALGRQADRQGRQGIGRKSVGKADRRTAGDHHR